MEKSNENFKRGKISIIVTTNMKKDFINVQKLAELLPNDREYSCNGIDRVVNLPAGLNISGKDQQNPNKIGNLPLILNLKVGAPVVITSNYTKAKYREDGIMNGGYVQAIQTSSDNQDIVKTVWILFNNEKVGSLYRFEQKYLRENQFYLKERNLPED